MQLQDFAAVMAVMPPAQAMLAIIHLLATFVANLFKLRRRLEVENLFLRHQLNVALRRAPQWLRLRGSDRALFVWMTWLWPSLLGLARVIQPDTILRWHRAGFRAYWGWKSRARSGRPKVCRELRELRSPWQKPYAERLIGTLRRDCLDHIRIFGERHLLGILSLYSAYYKESRAHLGLCKDAPLRRAVQRTGTIIAEPVLSGLHHRYARI